MSIDILLIGGPCAGQRLAITEAMWDQGCVLMEVYEGMDVNVAVESTPPLAQFKQARYIKRGRDNASFEFDRMVDDAR